MDIKDWTPFWKIDADDRTRCMSQQTYEPLISPDGKTFCANYDVNNLYQRHEDAERPLYTEEVVDYFFNKEVEYAKRFNTKPYGSEIVEIDYANKRIFYKWGKSCNELLYGDLGDMPMNWKEQVFNMLLDAYNEGVYKLTMYPHCFYVDYGDQLRTIDWYGCVEVADPKIDAKYMDGIIHETAKFRLEETGAIVDGKYNLETMYQRSMQEHVKWGEESMEWIYREIFRG